MRMMLAGLGLLIATAAFPTIASAQFLYGNAPWCAVVSTGHRSVQWDCRYATIEQCRPHVIAGNRGFCNLNPEFAQAATDGSCRTVMRRVIRDGRRVTVRRQLCR